MLRSNRGHKYILCITVEVKNYLITIPIHQAKSEEIGDALIKNVITKYIIPEYINNGPRWYNYQFHKFDIKINTVVPYNHQ